MSPRARAPDPSFDALWQQREEADRRAAEERERLERLKQQVCAHFARK